MTVQKITIDQVVYVGNTTSFRIVVTNTGDCNLSDVVVTDVDFSAGLVYADKYDNGSRSWNYLGNGKWILDGDLEPGMSALNLACLLISLFTSMYLLMVL